MPCKLPLIFEEQQQSLGVVMCLWDHRVLALLPTLESMC